MVEKKLENETADSNLSAVQDVMEEQAHDEGNNEGENRLQKMQDEMNELNDKYLRMVADFQNFRKRAEKEKADIYSYANEKLICDLLPILDNLERAVQSTKEDTTKEDTISKGVELVLQQFLDILKKNGVEEIQTNGVEFDPMLHHAVMQEDHPEYESNHITAVFQKGYTLNGKVIRPSMVKVAN